MYEENPLTSLAYKKVCDRLQRDHERLESVYKNVEQAKLYNKYYHAVACYAENNLKGDKLEYYYRITD